MAAVIGGAAAGYAMAILVSLGVAYLLARGIGSGTLDRWIDPGVPRPLIVVAFFLAATLGWIMAGTAIGLVYAGAASGKGPSAAGAENLWFALGITAVALVPLPLVVALARRQWWLWAGLSLAFAAMFGWVVPYLAEQ